MNKIRIAVAGASGRMGRMLVESTLKASDTTLVAAFDPQKVQQQGVLRGDLILIAGPRIGPLDLAYFEGFDTLPTAVLTDQPIEPAIKAAREIEIGPVDRQHERVVEDRAVEPVGHD